MDIKDINGIGEITLTKLADAGIVDLMSLACTSIKELSQKTGLSESKARKLSLDARKLLDLGFINGEKIWDERNKVKHITTGMKSFDKMLGGKGIETGAITQVYSKFGMGKTNIAMLLAVTAQLEEPKGVIYIDSESGFRPNRIEDFAKGFGVKEPLKNIHYAKAHNFENQVLLVEEAEKLIANGCIKLLILDSLTSHIRGEYSGGMGMLAERQQKLNKHLHQLLKICDLYNVAVFVTNQVISSPGQFFGDSTLPTGGNIVAHLSTFIIYLRPGKAGSVVAKLMDSPDLPNSQCNYNIGKNKFEEIIEKPKKEEKVD